MKKLRSRLALTLAAAAAAALTLPAFASQTLVVSGDEWQLGNEAFASALSGASTQALAGNIAGLFGGTNYVLVTNDVTYMPPSNLSSLASAFTALGKSVTFAGGFSGAELVGADAVMFFGRGPGVGEGAANATLLSSFIHGGGNVYVSLGTGAFGGPADEAAAWNPLLNNFGLNATSTGWFTVAGFSDTPVLANGSPLETGVSSLMWGYGQAVSLLDANNANTTLMLGDFGLAGVQGAIAVAHPVPEPGTWALMAAGLVLVGSLARRRRG